MKTDKLKISVVILTTLLAFSFCSCEKDEIDENKNSKNEFDNSFMPLEVGNYWKYNCKHSSSDNTKTEEEVTVAVISEDMPGIFTVEIEYPTYTKTKEIEYEQNGLLTCEGKILVCANTETVPVDDLSYLFTGPNSLSGANWLGTGKVNISLEGNEIEYNFDDKEVKYSTIDVEREQKLTARFKQGIGLEYYYFNISATTKTWNSFYGNYIYGYAYNIYTYSLIESNVDE